jgi:hypothetical protein
LCRKAAKPIFAAEMQEVRMNWVFETYSTVYRTAMMQDTSRHHPVAAKSRTIAKRPLLRDLLFRR